MPPPTSAIPARNPIATRSSGGIRLCSNEYFTKKATPRKRANPPIQANIFAPMNCSQSILRDGGAVVSKRISSTGVASSTCGIGGITDTGRGGGTETGGMIGSGGDGSVIIVGGSAAGAPSRGACARVSSMRSRSRSPSIARSA